MTLPHSDIEFLRELMNFSLDKGFYDCVCVICFLNDELFVEFTFLNELKDPWHIPVSKLNVIQTLYYLLSTFLNYLDEHGGFGEEDQRNTTGIGNNPPTTSGSKQYSPKYDSLLFCGTPSERFGGGLKREDNFKDDNLINQKEQVKIDRDPTTQEFDTFVRDLFNSNVNYAVYLPPDSRMIFDYMIDSNTFLYHEWDSIVPKTEQLIKNEHLQFVIPTVDIVRYSFLITAILIHKKPILLTGNSVVGKTLLIEAMLRSLTLPEGNFVPPGTILGDVLQYNATRHTTTSKLAQAGDIPVENTEGGRRCIPSKRLLQSFSIFTLPDPAAKQLFHIYSIRLRRFLNSLEFSVDVRSSLYLLVSTCLVMYYRISINILSTSSKVHIFNLSDLAKLAQGIMQVSPMNTTDQECLATLFAHECLRIFADRLVTESDLAIFYKHLNATVNSYFKISLDISKYSENPLFCNFLKSDDRLYQQLNDWHQCCSVFLAVSQIREIGDLRDL
ncbi:unnamed protein product [Rotaria sp. Silwood2]|nr:unnamed protein product [Rotaria sp. Silwood2]CAF4518993.1 unnamed protein product [Rotaria sp. Silwood2]